MDGAGASLSVVARAASWSEMTLASSSAAANRRSSRHRSRFNDSNSLGSVFLSFKRARTWAARERASSARELSNAAACRSVRICSSRGDTSANVFLAVATKACSACEYRRCRASSSLGTGAKTRRVVGLGTPKV
ncbi:hypothetical protein BDZ89DRAFT_362016 [Hymenopellis radicata]|nr:hypothetical protein BDZ89DRAFT_362016 [Hymenopellis radicata]